MANGYTTGQIIQGLGHALGGTLPQFNQQMQQLDEARMKAMYQDAGAAYQMYGQNNLGGIIDLANDRLSILRRLPGSDPSDTMQVLRLAQAAQRGDQNAYRQLGQVLQQANSTGIARGYVAAPAAPETMIVGEGQKVFQVGPEGVLREVARGAEKPQGVVLSDDAVRRLGLDPEKKWQRSATGQISEVGGSGQVINVGGEQNDLRADLFKQYVNAIPEKSTQAYQQISLASEAQTIADLMSEKDSSLFMKYMQTNYPDLAIMAFDEEGIATTANAIAGRLAPTMREEGSGSTSDAEMRQYLLSLPSLMASDAGRQLTAQIFQAKADIERDRLALYEKYINEEIGEKELTRSENALLKRPLFTEERKRKINSIVPGFFRDTPEMMFNPPPGITPANGNR